MKTQRIEFGGEEFDLHPHRAAHWRARRTLIIADLHLGKSSIFRERGLPVPGGSTASDLARLSAMISDLEPKRLLILGDLIHGRVDETSPFAVEFAAWRRQHASLAVEMVCGNHDRHCLALPENWHIEDHGEERIESNIVFAHAPSDRDPRPRICGHIHPSASLQDFDGGRVRVPCFVLDETQLILPAFGRFTGTATMKPTALRRLFATARDRIVCINPSRDLEPQMNADERG